MSDSGHFHSRYVHRNKQTGKEIKTFEDFPAAVRFHGDGTKATYRRGQMVPGTHVEAVKKDAKKDVPGGESKFYKQTEISTIVQKTRGETTTDDTMGEKETAARVRKKIDVNTPKMRM